MDFLDTVLGKQFANAVIAETAKRQYAFRANGDEELGKLIESKINYEYEYVTHIKTGTDAVTRTNRYLVIFRK